MGNLNPNFKLWSKMEILHWRDYYKFSVEFVYAFPSDYIHDSASIPRRFVEMVKKLPIHTVKVSLIVRLIVHHILISPFILNDKLPH